MNASFGLTRPIYSFLSVTILYTFYFSASDGFGERNSADRLIEIPNASENKAALASFDSVLTSGYLLKSLKSLFI